MRIIAGVHKGRKLKSSNNLSIRPTTDRIKEYIFNILDDFPLNKNVVDIFSGSGSLGLEAISRGATQTTFIEKATSSIDILKENIAHIKLSPDQYLIMHIDALKFAGTENITYDLGLIDPPFVYPQLQELLDKLFNGRIFHSNSIVVLEHEISNPISEICDVYEIIKQKKFGRSMIRFMVKKES